MKKILIFTLFLLLSPFFVYAQEDTKAEELVTTSSEVKAAEIEELDQQEEERTQEIANLLGFVLPEYTDNPSYVITFKDPSPDAQGVEIEIDETPFKKITSPYTFPALSIGQHSIKFRFYDKDSNVQLLQYDLVIIPRSPIITSPSLTDNSIEIKGTALANSEVIYTLTANAYNDNGIVQTDENGDWKITITPEGGLADGIYTFRAYTRKYGYASNISNAVTFGVGENPNRFLENDENEIYFAFKDLNSENFFTTFSTFPDLIILSAGSLLIGLLLTLGVKTLIDRKKDGKKDRVVEEIISKGKKDDKKEEKTLREIFGGKEEQEEKEEKETEEEREKEPSIINKDIFLKKYKPIDPDTPTGKEKDSEKIKNIRVSLTSKDED